MSSYRPDSSDMDHAQWLNGRPVREMRQRSGFVKLTAAEMAAELRRICGPALDQIRGVEQSNHRCPHGINAEKAACGQCMRDDETMGAAMAARFDKGQR